MFYLRAIIIILLSVILAFNLSSKDLVDSTLIDQEIVIKTIAQELYEVRLNDKLVDSLNNQLILNLEESLNKEGSFYHPFDSIFPISKIVSKDKNVRIFSWYTINSMGIHKQYGYIQYYLKSSDKVFLYKLEDKSGQIENPQNVSLTPNNWYGAVYYDILENKYNGTTLYTLLGWDGNDLSSNKKVIESLVFTNNGRPKFGKTVFVFGREKAKRVIFEYSRMVNMMIRFDSDLKMIVMDHLSPGSQIYYGNYKYYGPDFSYDALKYEKEYWQYITDIDYKRQQEKKSLKNRWLQRD